MGMCMNPVLSLVSVWTLAPLCQLCCTPLCHKENWWQVACSKVCRHMHMQQSLESTQTFLTFSWWLEVHLSHCIYQWEMHSSGLMKGKKENFKVSCKRVTSSAPYSDHSETLWKLILRDACMHRHFQNGSSCTITPTICSSYFWLTAQTLHVASLPAVQGSGTQFS